ncbi:MAG TPA: prolyl oligopeptidase family serine peptidase [Saprospiraceae bacterium]|nr:prolyl oligopeptidase family serine peptidase [Saprospiraceae bacterium]
MKRICILLSFFAVTFLSAQSFKNSTIKVKYPTTKTVHQADDYFGTLVDDPYRWLEIDTAAEVEKWVVEENKVTSDYFKQIPYKDKIRARYEELFNYPKLSSPGKVGRYYIFSKNDGLQNQAVYYIQDGPNGKPEVLIDPNILSKDGTIAIGLMGHSKDNKYLAYTKSAAGSDWSEIRVIDLDTRKDIPDVINWVKFSGAAWQGHGFYYSRFPEPKGGGELSDANKFHSVYFHKLGEPQSKDELIFSNDKEPLLTHSASVSESEQYVFVYAASGTDGFETYYKDMYKADKGFIKLFSGFEHKSTMVEVEDNKFLIQTDIDAPNYRLVAIDPYNPDKSKWKNIIPESRDFLESVGTAGGKIFATYLHNATSKVMEMNMDGSNVKEINLPGLGSAGGFSGNKDDTEVFYTYASFVFPPSIFKYTISSGTTEQFFKTELKFDPKDYEENQVFYPSKDGTKVSMFLVHKKALKLDGNNPCYLYSYGGFNIPMMPGFSASRMLLLENGGVFAMPNIRGGSEYGEAWHKGGMLEKKQNVFDDFISAAEYLIKEKYTNKSKLAIAGGSNGGLLVGACMTQRPDLFAVAFPAVGVMDMLRFHKFTIGWAWVPEYGSSDKADQFKYLFKYSPYHNLKKGVNYPATLVTTADHDDRVVPAHSFKFAAMLQNCQTGTNPTLIRIETKAGHGAGKPTSKIIDEQSDIWSFFFYNTDSKIKY